MAEDKITLDTDGALRRVLISAVQMGMEDAGTRREPRTKFELMQILQQEYAVTTAGRLNAPSFSYRPGHADAIRGVYGAAWRAAQFKDQKPLRSRAK